MISKQLQITLKVYIKASLFMNKVLKKSKIIKKLLVSIGLFISINAYADNFIEGKDYKVIPKSNATKQGKSLIEFFSYGCPWCFELEPKVEALAKSLPEDVHFKRVPVTFEPKWDMYAKAYYAAKALKQENTLTPLIFETIQKKDGLKTEDEMMAFFIHHGADEKFVKSAFTTSPTMDALVKKSTTLMQQYQVYAVPSFVINERYKTDLALVKGDKEKLFAVVTFLLNKQS